MRLSPVRRIFHPPPLTPSSNYQPKIYTLLHNTSDFADRNEPETTDKTEDKSCDNNNQGNNSIINNSRSIMWN